MTSKDLKAMEASANNHRAQGSPPLPLSEEAARQGLRMVEHLEASIQNSEQCLKALKELYRDFPLVQAHVGAMGEEITEMRSHLPALHHEAEEAK